MRIVRRLFVAVAAVTLLPSLAFAQASIAGIVRDTSGGVLPGVTVEAASPVLIEKIRTVVTDGNGRYQIVDLRPGVYSVTFVLPGFNTVRREGVTLTGAATAIVDAEMRVGALEETVTVTGEAPVVDVRSVTRQSVLSADVIDALPTSRNYATLARLIPGTNSNVNDVGGGAIQDVGGSTTIHGSKNTDQRVTLNGINTMTLQAGGNIGGQIPDVGSAAEITVDTSSLSADLPTGGVRINFVPKDGGNTFSGSTFFTFSNEDLQGDNFTAQLRAAGLPTPNKVLKTWDLNASFGGPFRRDRVWFWFSARVNEAHNQAPILKNANAFKPNEWLYVPVERQPGVNKGIVLQSSLRVTWQASPKHKIAGTYKADRWCNCPNNISATVAPEAGRDRRFPRLRQEHLEWTAPLTNRLLLEAVGMHLYERWGNMHYRVKGGSLENAAQEAAVPLMIPVTEQSTGLLYRSQQTFNNTRVPNYAYRAAMSYVTGTHAFRVGFNRTHGYLEMRTYNFQPYAYRFNNGIPNQVTIFATPYTARSHLDNDLGVYAQDRWTLSRSTINLALRYDYFHTSFPAQTLGPGLLVPNRNLSFPAQDNLGWHDLTWRAGISYDLRGDGRTAIKAAVNKYLLGQTLNGIASSPNPINALVTSTTRSWADANRNFVPDCDLTMPGANGECGPMANRNFGTVVPANTFDKDLLRGWGHRPWNVEFTVGVQHEVVPRMSVDIGWFRRVWGNFTVTDNLLVDADDFDYFVLTAPAHVSLPRGGGYTIEGVRDVKPVFFGLEQNYLSLSDKYGKQIEHWNGVDVTFSARLDNGFTVQAGTSTGRTTEDDCEVAAKLPEMNISRPLAYCARQEPWLTQFKGYAVYTIPSIDVLVAGTFRSTPGAAINANFTATNAYLAANSTLGRALAGNAANMTVELLRANSMYLERRNELDVRFGKVVRFGKARSFLSLDIFNALNTDVPIAVNQSFAAWLRPTSILNARMFKISMNLDF